MKHLQTTQNSLTSSLDSLQQDYMIRSIINVLFLNNEVILYDIYLGKQLTLTEPN